jgi:DNA-binding response OmpR family regulator
VPRILVVEDDHDMRKLVIESFRKAGHEVLEAEHGRSWFDTIAASLGRPLS